MITAKAADIFRDEHIRSQSYFINERKAQRGWRQWLPERYGKGVYPLGLVNILIQVFFYYTKRESGDT
jgi:hypothetical protein